MKTGVNAIDSDDEEENAKQDRKMNYKKLDIKKVVSFWSSKSELVTTGFGRRR